MIYRYIFAVCNQNSKNALDEPSLPSGESKSLWKLELELSIATKPSRFEEELLSACLVCWVIWILSSVHTRFKFRVVKCLVCLVDCSHLLFCVLFRYSSSLR